MSSTKLDSKNAMVRAIERWKRGACALIMIVMLGLAAMLVSSVIGGVAYWLGFDEILIGVIALLIIAPWMVGDRKILKIIGALAKSPDNIPEAQ